MGTCYLEVELGRQRQGQMGAKQDSFAATFPLPAYVNDVAAFVAEVEADVPDEFVGIGIAASTAGCAAVDVGADTLEEAA